MASRKQTPKSSSTGTAIRIEIRSNILFQKTSDRKGICDGCGTKSNLREN